MRLIVGLGNPGPQYVWTRHNVGWLAADHLAQSLGLGSPRERFDSLLWDRFALDGEPCCLMKPTTYMNLSGRAVAQAVRFYKLDPQDVMVIYDDVALPFGRLRMRDRGSAGGQKGMGSIIGALGTLEIPRIRVGVGSPPDPRMDLADWVLSRLSPREVASWPKVAQGVHEALSLWIREGVQRAMSKVNAKGFCPIDDPSA